MLNRYIKSKEISINTNRIKRKSFIYNKTMQTTSILTAKVELPEVLQFPLQFDIVTGITLPTLSPKEKELVEILQTNGGFYYTGTFPSVVRLQTAVTIRRAEGKEAEWSYFYIRDILHPQQSYHSFISDLEVFSVVESIDFPFLPIMILDFEKVMRKYGSTRLVNFILRYQLHLRKPFTEDIIRSCTITEDGRILGIEYGDVICNMEPFYMDVDLAEGQYTYVAAIVNGKISIGYKQCLHAEEIGSKHVCIYRKFMSMDPNTKVIIAGEVEFKNKKYTYNMQSGTFSTKVIVQTLDTLLNSTWPTDRDEFNTREENLLPIAGSVNAEEKWWIPLIKFLMFEGEYKDEQLITPAARLTIPSITKLCALSGEEKNIHEFGNINTCVAWSKFDTPDIDKAKLLYAQSFCYPSMDMRKFIGLKLVSLLAKEHNIELKDINTVVLSPELSITSEIVNVGGQSIIVRGMYKGIEVVIKIATTYSEKELLQRELNVLTDLKDVPNIVLPLTYYTSTNGLSFIVFPYYNRGNLSNFDIDMKLDTISPKLIFPIAVQVASDILPALEGMHNKGYIHLDVSFSNIVVNTVGMDTKFALTDMGMAQPITMFQGDVSIQAIRNASRNSIYEAINIAKLIPPTYASDYESLGYVLYDLVYANLPWNRMPPSQAISLKEAFDAKLFSTYFQLVRTGATAKDLLAALQAEQTKLG